MLHSRNTRTPIRWYCLAAGAAQRAGAAPYNSTNLRITSCARPWSAHRDWVRWLPASQHWTLRNSLRLNRAPQAYCTCYAYRTYVHSINDVERARTIDYLIVLPLLRQYLAIHFNLRKTKITVSSNQSITVWAKLKYPIFYSKVYLFLFERCNIMSILVSTEMYLARDWRLVPRLMFCLRVVGL